MSNPNQRTKGNTKPSNSERAARLLPANQFLSFSQASQTLSDVYASTAATGGGDNDSSSFKYGINSDFQVIFKHMTKKDINTKLKALQDFNVLCSSKSKEELLQTASYWYRIYRKLSNVIDWRVRQEVHNAHYHFISKFDRDTIINDIQTYGVANVSETSSEATNEVSFQNLITMPAIMWISCFDAYSQAADSAKKAFAYLYPTENSRIEFILENYDSILNYCTYCIFDKIPIKLFYTNPLSPDSVKVFEEHMLVTTLRGLSSLVNELICFYLEIENDSAEALQNRIFLCMEQLFLKINTEFGKSKFPHLNQIKSKEIENVADMKDLKGTHDDAFLSKKDKKKLKKEEKEKENASRDQNRQKGHCKFWLYFCSENASIRVSYFLALNSITRLSTIMFENSQLKESSIFEQLSTSNLLWFKLYKTNLYENIFRSFIDPVPDIRGLAWLLGIHILSYKNLFKPWSVLNLDKWLKETLITFVSNGMRTTGGIVDFGLFNIGLQNYQRLYPEFFAKKYPHLSGLQLTCDDNYAELDILANVKLVIVFADAFNSQVEDKFSLKIYQTLLHALNEAFSKAYLQKDLDFLIEIYFNLIYHLVIQCLQFGLNSTTSQPASDNFIEEHKLNILFEQVFQTHVRDLVVSSFDISKSDLLFNSQIYLNLLLLVHHTSEYYKDVCRKESNGKILLAVNNLFKFNVHKVYSSLFGLINSELSCLVKSEIKSKFQLNRLLRFLNDAILFRHDGYFSSEFYYNKSNTNYDKNALKSIRACLNKEAPNLEGTKRVNFSQDQSEVISSTDPTADWWTTRQQKSIFYFCLANSNYSELSKRISFCLLTDYSSLLDEVILLVVSLIKLLDHQVEQFKQNVSPGRSLEENLLLVVQHVQYILRIFNSQQLSILFSKLDDQNSTDLLYFVQGYLIKWVDSLYPYICNLDQQQLSSMRFYVMIGSKIFDIFFVALSTQEETALETVIKTISFNTKPFAFCLLLSQLNRLSTLPSSLLYNATTNRFQKYLTESVELSGTLLLSQIDTLFEHSKCQNLDCDILNTLLHFFLNQNAISNEQMEFRILKIKQVLTLLLQNLDKNSNNDLTKGESFLLDFPLMCREIYDYLFKNDHLLNRIDDFVTVFISFCKIFFKQTFTAATISTGKNTYLKRFIDYSSAFWTFVLGKLFATLPKYESNLISLVQELINIVIEEIILSPFWNSSNFNQINCEIKQFFNALFTQFRSVLQQLDKEDLVQIQNKFEQIQVGFYTKISEKVKPFLLDNVYGNLYELENDNSNSLSRLYAIYDIFQSKDVVNMLESVNDSDRFDALSKEKLADFKNSLYISNAQASIVGFLLSNVYQDSVYRKHFRLPEFLATDEQVTFDILPVIRTLARNMYHFDRFINFYFYNSHSEKQEYIDVYNCLSKEIELIIKSLHICLKKKDKCEVISLIRFLICSDNNQDIFGLSYANFIVGKFFPATNWLDILNYIGLPTKYDILKANQITCLFISNTENAGKINEILAQVLRHFEGSIRKLSHEPESTETSEGDTKDTKASPLFDWSKLSINDVNQVLFVIDFAFYKLRSLLSSCEQSESINELKERLLNFLTLLCWGKLENLFEPYIPQFSQSKYLTFLLNAHLMADAVHCLHGNTKPEHFRMFLSVLKSWIQILYTSLPEAIENETPQKLNLLVMTSRIVHTLNLFGEMTLTMSKDDDSQLELIELWRNFLAFDSFNMILPLFVVLNNSPKRNLIEQVYLKRLVKTIDYVDVECLQDISTLELNQYLLMFPEEKANQRSLETMLNKFMENAHLNQNTSNFLGSTSRKNTTTLSLTPSNNYYEYLLSHVTPLLLHSDFNWSLSAFQILSIMFQDLPWSQKGNAQKKNPTSMDDSMLLNGIDSSLLSGEDTRLGPPESFSHLLVKLDSVTEYILMDCEFGQSVMIEPGSDLYNYSFAYLLVWLLYLHLMDPFPMDDTGEARADLIHFLTERNLHIHLFDNLFHLMLNIEEENTDSQQTKMEEISIVKFLKQIRYLKDVQNLGDLIFERDLNSLSKLSLCVYYQVLRYLPNLLRAWFGNLKPQHKQIVDDFTIRNYSDLLIENELEHFRTTDREKFGNIIIRTSKKANEITAVYSLREISFGIRFTFKANYPLTPVGIECFNRSGVSEDRCRKWIHRLNTFFNKQNCSILNGIIMLRPNMDKFFEDIEECMICLFVLYGATADLPRFKCPQCRKKFHWACIRKWFQTNDNSSCPQCKFEFN